MTTSVGDALWHVHFDGQPEPAAHICDRHRRAGAAVPCSIGDGDGQGNCGHLEFTPCTCAAGERGAVCVACLRTEASASERDEQPIPLVIRCPKCGLQHIDEGEWATTRVHRTHLCAGCGHLWRPFQVPTVGVARLESDTAA